MVGLVVVCDGVGLGFGVDGGDDSVGVGLGAGADVDLWLGVGAGAGALLDELCVAGGVLPVVPLPGVVLAAGVAGDRLAVGLAAG